MYIIIIFMLIIIPISCLQQQHLKDVFNLSLAYAVMNSNCYQIVSDVLHLSRLRGGIAVSRSAMANNQWADSKPLMSYVQNQSFGEIVQTSPFKSH